MRILCTIFLVIISTILFAQQTPEWIIYNPSNSGLSTTSTNPSPCATAHTIAIENDVTKKIGKNIFGWVFYRSGGVIISVEDKNIFDLPTEFQLFQNYPNPFNPSTTIKYTIPNVGSRHTSTPHVTLKVYDLLDNEIATLVNDYKQLGTYVETFHGTSLPSGVYIYRLTAGAFSQTKKMLLIK